jgi:general secretion pathway protein D
LRRSDLSRDLRSQRAPQRAVEPQPLRGLTAEEIQALEGAAPGEGAVAAAELLRRRQATIYVTVIRRHNQIAVRTSDDRNMEQVRDLIRRLDVPTPLVLLEVKVLGIELGDGFRSAFDFQFVEGEAAGGFTTGDILPPAGASPSLLGSQLIPGALAFQYVGNQFRARMQLLENENRVTELATPLLLTANNEVSRLFVGEERPLNRSFSGSQTVVGDSTIVTPGSTTIEFRPVGTTLLITPNINADRTVSMRILQEISSISPNPATVLVPTSNGFAEQQVDVVQARSVSGTIVAKDGLAVAIGGLIEEQLTDSQQRVPILGNLPGVGFLFRKDTQSKTRRELVILVRPFVLYTPAESERISRDLLEELSLHPKAGDPRGHLGTHGPRDVVRPRTDPDRLRRYFRFHSLTPEERE